MDCAHFVSSCIGNDGGGGLPVPHDYKSYIYGYVSSTRLANWLINSGNAVEVGSLGQLEKGDVIFYDLNENGLPDHSVLYLGDGMIAAHSACYWIENWDIYNPREGYYKFVHIKSPTAQPDLIVEDIWVDPDPPIAGASNRIKFRIKNQGDGDATGTFRSKLYFDGVYKGYAGTSGLTAGSTKTYYWDMTWPSDSSPHTIKVVTDANGVISESNDGNNERSESFSAEPNQPPTLISPLDNSHQTSSITFQWSSVSSATNYEFFLKIPDNPSWLSDQTTSTSYPYSPTLIGEYHWRVRAYVSGSWSDYSDEWIFYFDGAPAPTLISPPNNAEITILRPMFQWNSVLGSISYQLQLARDSSFTDMVRYNLGIASTSWQLDTDLTAGQTYYWRVRSGIPIGFWSTVWHFRVVEPTHPPTVTTNAATNVEETTATLNGVISSDGGEACQYRFEYDTNSGEPYAYNTGWTGSKTTGQSFNAAIPSLVKGTKYYFRAQAKNSAGTASGSELTFLTKPDAPTSFSATTAGTTQIDLSWTKGTGAQKTKIQRKQESYPENRNDGTQVYFGTGSSTPDTELTPGTTYYYRAWSYVQGSEQWSNSYAQDWANTTSIGAPTVTTNAATNEGTDSAQLNGYLDDMRGANICDAWFVWNTSYHSDYNDYGYSTSPQTKSSTGSFDDSISGLEPDTTYHFRAVASNSKGTNCGSDMTFTTSEEADTTPPTWGTMIGIQSATDTGNGGEVTVTYGTATDADSPPVKYNAYYSTSSPATGGTKVSNVGSSPYTVTGLTNGQLYYFSVRAEDSATPPNEDTNTFELTATPTAPLTPNKVYLDPPHSSASFCNPTIVQIWISGTDIAGAYITFTYDPACVNTTDVQSANFPRDWDWNSAINGKEIIAGTTSDGLNRTGNYLFANLTIHCLSKDCVTGLNFLEGSDLFDQWGILRPATWTGGTFTCLGPTPPECEGTDTSCGIYPDCENCTKKDGCYPYGNGCEERDYYCKSNEEGCDYTYSNRHTDAWVDTGNTRWVDDPENECKEKEQKEQKYHNYSCSEGTCTYSVADTQWIDTGDTKNKPDGTICGCTANNTLKRCYEGTCTDTGICNSTNCTADVACDGKEPGESCGAGRICNSTCKCVSSIAPPEITSYAPDSPVNDPEGATRTFNIIINQTVNVSWQIDGTEVQTNASLTAASYTNTSAVIGTWNVSAIVTNANGTDMQTWTWTVTSPCFIATAAYGTPLHEDIDVLRDFRDEYMMPNPAGRAFVKTIIP